MPDQLSVVKTEVFLGPSRLQRLKISERREEDQLWSSPSRPCVLSRQMTALTHPLMPFWRHTTEFLQQAKFLVQLQPSPPSLCFLHVSLTPPPSPKPPVTHTMAIPNPTAALSSAATCPALCPHPRWDSGASISSQPNHGYQWWNSSWLQVVPTYATANWEQTQLRNRGATSPSSPSYLPGTQSSLSLPSYSPWLQQNHDLSFPSQFWFWFGLFKAK